MLSDEFYRTLSAQGWRNLHSEFDAKDRLIVALAMSESGVILFNSHGITYSGGTWDHLKIVRLDMEHSPLHY